MYSLEFYFIYSDIVSSTKKLLIDINPLEIWTELIYSFDRRCIIWKLKFYLIK